MRICSNPNRQDLDVHLIPSSFPPPRQQVKNRTRLWRSSRSGTTTASLLGKELRPASTSAAALHGRRQASEVFHASAPLAGAEDKLQSGITPYATWANTRPHPALHLNLHLLLYNGNRHPNPALHPPTRAPAARGIGSGRLVATLNGSGGETSGKDKNRSRLYLFESTSFVVIPYRSAAVQHISAVKSPWPCRTEQGHRKSHPESRT